MHRCHKCLQLVASHVAEKAMVRWIFPRSFVHTLSWSAAGHTSYRQTFSFFRTLCFLGCPLIPWRSGCPCCP
jgi:hypothetical protein